MVDKNTKKKDEIPHSAEAMAEYEDRAIIKALKEKYPEHTRIWDGDRGVWILLNLNPKSRIKLDSPEAQDKAMRLYCLTCPHDDCSSPMEKKDTE